MPPGGLGKAVLVDLRTGSGQTTTIEDARDLPSAARRPVVVQARLSDGGRPAEPIFGSSALLTVLTAADGYLIVPEDANGLSAGEPVEVIPYG